MRIGEDKAQQANKHEVKHHMLAEMDMNWSLSRYQLEIISKSRRKYRKLLIAGETS